MSVARQGQAWRGMAWQGKEIQTMEIKIERGRTLTPAEMRELTGTPDGEEISRLQLLGFRDLLERDYNIVSRTHVDGSLELLSEWDTMLYADRQCRLNLRGLSAAHRRARKCPRGPLTPGQIRMAESITSRNALTLQSARRAARAADRTDALLRMIGPREVAS